MMTDATFFTRIAPPMTPILVVRRAALLANLAAMQAACDARSVALRAHGKMHKTPALGALQVAHGAVGLCCQTVSEAAAFAAAGLHDLLVTAPVAAWGVPRLAALAADGHAIGLVADDAAQIARAGAAAVAAGTVLRLVVDVDLGLHRTGVAPEEVAALATLAAATPGLRYGGIQAYLGHLQHLADRDARAAKVATAMNRLTALVDELTAKGLAPPVVTGGGTGTFVHDLDAGVFTELQCGSYALMDVEYGDCGAPGGGDWPFVPALFVAATVVSARHKTHVTCDAGLKALSSDGPQACVVAGAAAGSLWRAMGDEHGAVVHPAFLGQMRDDPAGAVDRIDADPAVAMPGDAPRAGDIVWLQPGHCDPTINLHDALWVADEDGSLERWPVTARRTTA